MPRARNHEIFVPGQLSYLPKRRDDEPSPLPNSEIPDGCFDHPVVILSTNQCKREAVVFIVSLENKLSPVRTNSDSSPLCVARALMHALR